MIETPVVEQAAGQRSPDQRQAKAVLGERKN
jgi:hypothetical protein